MTPLLKSCLECGELSDAAHCDEHRPRKSYLPKNRRDLGYDAAWDKLSARARRIQPWCSDCGTTEDLTADHSPEAWQRKAEGLPIRLQDIDVVCRSDNAKRSIEQGNRSTWGVGVDVSLASPPCKAKFLTDTPRGYARRTE